MVIHITLDGVGGQPLSTPAEKKENKEEEQAGCRSDGRQLRKFSHGGCYFFFAEGSKIVFQKRSRRGKGGGFQEGERGLK